MIRRRFLNLPGNPGRAGYCKKSVLTKGRGSRFKSSISKKRKVMNDPSFLFVGKFSFSRYGKNLNKFYFFLEFSKNLSFDFSLKKKNFSFFFFLN